MTSRYIVLSEYMMTHVLLNFPSPSSEYTCVYYEKSIYGTLIYADPLLTSLEHDQDTRSHKLVTGDVITLELDIEIVKLLQEDHGGWNDIMAEVHNYSTVPCSETCSICVNVSLFCS